MPQLITYGNELIRINPANNRIEYSTNRGISWISRYSGSSCGTFRLTARSLLSPSGFPPCGTQT